MPNDTRNNNNKDPADRVNGDIADFLCILTELYLNGVTNTELVEATNATTLIAIRKNDEPVIAKAKLRPIGIPTIANKLMQRTTLASVRSQLAQILDSV